MYAFWNSVLRPALDTLKPRHVVEVGIADGLMTKPLAAYCTEHHARLSCIDIFPQFDIASLQKQHTHVQFFHEPSLEILPTLQEIDVAFLDGDHNWYTVHEELQTLAKVSGGVSAMPVTFVHDIGWPYGHRDLYYALHTLPEHARRPFAAGGVLPDHDQLIVDGGLNHKMFHAITEGGEKNGVGCAVDDFLQEAGGEVEVFRLPLFHGLAILYPKDTLQKHAAFGELLTSLSRTPVLEQVLVDVERDRVTQQARVYQLRYALFLERQRRWEAETISEKYRDELAQKTITVRRMEASRSWRFTVWLRHLNRATFTSPCRFFTACKEQWFALGFPALTWFAQQRSALPSVPQHAHTQHDTSHYPEDVAMRFHAGASSLSVIVTARNNGPFLRECLESITQQTVKPMEIIYCDDGSTDDSVAIASSVRGVTVLAREHEGVVRARNAAVALSTGNLLLHVDGDDMLTPTYIATMIEKLSWYPDAAFVYGGRKSFGLENEIYLPAEWNLTQLWRDNYINTSSIIRRDAFLAVGGWRDTVGTLWDWDLYLRLSRIGYGVRADAVLLYRRHEQSWSQVARQMSQGDKGLLSGRARRAAAKVSICCVYGGRLPELLPMWIEAIAASVRACHDSVDLPDLLILDNSTEGIHERVMALTSTYEKTFHSVTVIPYREKISWQSEMERRHKVSMFLAKAYNTLLAATQSEIVWLVEDDILVPEHAYSTLLRALTDGEYPPAAVSGLYRNRHIEDWLGHHVDAHGKVVPVDVSSGEPVSIDLAGTGCLMIFRPFAPHTFESHWRGDAQAHDWAWSEKTRRAGKQIVLYPSVRCRHYSDTSTWV